MESYVTAMVLVCADTLRLNPQTCVYSWSMADLSCPPGSSSVTPMIRPPIAPLPPPCALIRPLVGLLVCLMYRFAGTVFEFRLDYGL